MTNTLADYLNLNEPPSNSLPDIVSWICSRPGHAKQAADRNLTVNTSKVSLVRESDTSKPANFLLVGRAAQTYFKRTAGGYQQWGLILSEPSSEAAFAESQGALKSALEQAAGEGVVNLNIRAGTDLRFSRYCSDYHEQHETFPEIFDYTKGGDFNAAPKLEDVSYISSRSLVAVAFTVKMYDPSKLPNSNTSSPTTLDTPRSPSPAPVRGRKGNGKGKGKRDESGEDVESAVEVDVKPKSYGCRLELSAVWFLGRDDEDLLEGSPTKAPRF